MNCLTYLLNLIDKGKEMKILYNSDHCIGESSDGFEYDYDYRMRGDERKYLPIEKCHTKEVIKEIFNLDENYSKILDKYFGGLK